MMRNRKLLITLMTALALGAGVVAGSYAFADDNSDDCGSLPESAQLCTNESGLTYGSAAFVNAPDEEPDLILVVATNGREGYVYKVELDGDLPKTPSEALRNAAKTRLIPVYSSNGKTQIGVFETDSPVEVYSLVVE